MPEKIRNTLFYNLHARNWRADLFGGLTVAVIALPLSLAFGIASGLGAMAGLYSAIFLGFFAALFGGSPAQISGPNGPMTVVMASVFAQFPDRPAMCFAAVILAGLMQIVGGMARVGKYIALVPYPVISGFMSGVGIIIIVLQITTLSGHASYANMIAAIQHMPAYWHNPNWDAVILGLISLFIVVFTPSFVGRVIPAPLIALILGTLLGNLIWDGAPQIGSIPTGFPQITWPQIAWSDLPLLLLPAFMLAVLGSIDSLMTSTVADSMTRIYHKPNKELVGQGIGNMIAGLFGGIAGSGATMRTSVNIRAGGRTPIAGMTHALILLGLVLGLAPMAEHIPHAVLAGILLRVGYDIIDWHFIKKFPSAPRFNIFLMLLVILLTVAVDLISAVAVGVILAALHLAKNLADTQLRLMQPLDARNAAESGDSALSELMKKYDKKIIVYRLQGPLSFGGATTMARLLGSFDMFEALFLDLSGVYYIDTTSVLAIEDILAQARENQKKVYLVGLNDQIRLAFERHQSLGGLGNEYLTDNLTTAIRHFDESLHMERQN